MVFWNCMKIVWLAFFHTFDVGNCKISIFGVGKCKISIWRTMVVFQLHISVTLPFQAFLLVLISFLYETAQKPLKNLLEKPFKNHRKIWAVWAVFPKKNRPNRSNLAGKPLKPPISWAVFEWDLDRYNYRGWRQKQINTAPAFVQQCSEIQISNIAPTLTIMGHLSS